MFQVPVRDAGHNLRDAAYLIGQVGGHEIDRVGEVFPSSSNAAHHRLSSEFPFSADLARDTRYFRRKRVQLVHHRVDGVLQLKDLALNIDGDFLGQIASCDRRGHCRDVTDLCGQIARHEIHRIGQIFPSSRNTFYPGLTSERSIRSHFARHACHLRRERAQLIHHRVDRVLQFENFSANIDRDLFRKVSIRDRSRDFSDVTDLTG